MMNSMQAMLGQAESQDGRDTNTLRLFIESVNIAEKLDEEVLKEISAQVSEGFEYDLRSREDWEKCLDEWTDLALQVKEEKNSPWPGASNVKYPLLSTAAMQFNARSYPSLVPSTGDLVKCEVIGSDPTQQKLERAKRVSRFMSYQLLHEMEGWEEDMDKLLIMLPIVGTLFKKTYYNSVLKRNISELVMPKDVVVNFWAKNLETAERISQIIRLNKRQIKERQLSKLYLEVDLGEPNLSSTDPKVSVEQDNTLPYEIIEQHTYLDLDDDGYDEPYVVTFDRASQQILRIAARFDETTVKIDAEGNLQQILPIQYYTKFSFIPNPNGGFYDIGFGLLLTPINESVNTLINQLIDAGTLNNLQGGILGKGIKLKMGENQWKPGEWKTALSAVDDLRKQILPLPTKEPSKVLFELMGTMVTSGKELASVAEIFVGKMPGQNTPATTTMATIEQGMKVFTAVYKRIYRSLKSEYKKLYALNRIYFDPEKYAQVLDSSIQPTDFDEISYDVCPTADPSTPTQTEKLLKAQGLLELLQLGTLDPLAVTIRVLEAQEQPNIEQLFNQQIKETGQFTPPPDPKVMAAQMKAEMDAQKMQMQQQMDQFKMELEARDKVMQMMMKAQEHQVEMQHKQEMAAVDTAVAVQKQRTQAITGAAQTAQKLQQGEAQHQQQMQQAKEKQSLAKQQTATSSKTGKPTQSQKRSSKR
jgi:chaperonin GroES